MTNNFSFVPDEGALVTGWLLDQGQSDPFIWGWMPIYPIFIFLGVMAVLIASIIKFKMRKIPLHDLGIGIFIVIPAGIIGASIFGKFNILYDNWRFWELLFFWQAGMSIFGGLLFGGAAGFLYFHKKANHYQISVWVYADCILPNVLLGQAIGRWGNLFNHEIMGKPTSLESLQSWLPDWIVGKLWYVQNPDPSAMETDLWFVEFREPLFLYESLANILLFLVLTFLIANLGRFFSKKPWKIHPLDFPNFLNKTNKWIDKEELPLWNTQRAINYKKRQIDGRDKISLGWWESWNKAYYLRVLDNDQINYFSNKEKTLQTEFDRHDQKLEKVIQSRSNELMMTKKSLSKKLSSKNKKLTDKEIKNEYKANIKAIKNNYADEIKTLKKQNSWIRRTWSKDSKELYKAYNPENYFVIHSGTLSAAYIVGYMIIRWVLETRRTGAELLFKHAFVADMIVFFIFTAFGVSLFVFAQFISPKKWRKINWLYEKSY